MGSSPTRGIFCQSKLILHSKLSLEMNESNNSIKLKPTEHFRAMCGKEALNSEGKLSKNNALNLLEHYIRVHKLEEHDGIIIMNEWFQKLVQEFKSTIYRSELPKIVEKFFTE